MGLRILISKEENYYWRLGLVILNSYSFKGVDIHLFKRNIFIGYLRR